MTENEALKLMESLQISHDCEIVKTLDFQGTVIKALEDLQQYRAIGTVEELKAIKEHMWTSNDIAKEYLAIGTIEEFKALKEKSVEKKAIRITGMCYAKAKDGTDNYEIIEECPTCKKRLCAVSFNVGYCKCGQKITI